MIYIPAYALNPDLLIRVLKIYFYRLKNPEIYKSEQVRWISGNHKFFLRTFSILLEPMAMPPDDCRNFR